jgi:galactokinase
LTAATIHDERAARLVEHLARLDAGAAAAQQTARLVRAPGRVNLIGEHTDYNLGLVMPAAIGLETWIASLPREDGRVEITSLQEPETGSFELNDVGPPTGGWIDYVAGVVKVLGERGVPLRGVTAVVDSEIPIGAGLSSSAALELAAAWTVSEVAPPPLDPMSLAQAAQRAENQYVGVKSGLMDQFASVHGVADKALLFDCRSLEYETVPLPAGHTLVALDTRSPHKLGASEYNLRRSQCERGVAAIARRDPSVRSLRDVTVEMLNAYTATLDDETMRRCVHVVNENERVVQAAAALRTDDLDEVGRLFAESHASLRDMYEVSSIELDALVEIATAVPGVVGARMTGAGFGGCTVNLVRDDAVDALRAAVDAQYQRRSGHEAGFYVVSAVEGAGLVSGDPR